MKNKAIQFFLLMVMIFTMSCQKDIVLESKQIPVQNMSLMQPNYFDGYTFLISKQRYNGGAGSTVAYNSNNYTFPFEIGDTYFRRHNPNTTFTDPTGILDADWENGNKDELRGIAVVSKDLGFDYVFLYDRSEVEGRFWKQHQRIVHVKDGKIIRSVPLSGNGDISFTNIESPYRDWDGAQIYGSKTLYAVGSPRPINNSCGPGLPCYTTQLYAINIETGAFQEMADVTVPDATATLGQIYAVSTWEKNMIITLSLKHNQVTNKLLGYVRFFFPNGVEWGQGQSPIKVLEISSVNNPCYNRPLFQVERSPQGLYTYYIGVSCSNNGLDLYQCKMPDNGGQVQQTYLGNMPLAPDDNIDITRTNFEMEF
jgi:hypothetical protein